MLFQEYALDPKLLNNWKDFRYFFSAFGWNTGRLISRYPSRWKRLVYDHLGQCSPIEQQRIVERLHRIDEKMVTRLSEWDPSQPDWLINAEAEHVKRPFTRLVASENPREKEAVLVGDCLDEEDESWRLRTDIDVERKSRDLADAVQLMLRSARRISLIDPHFGPENRRHIEPLKSFIQTCQINRTVDLLSFEYHTEVSSTNEFFAETCHSQLQGCLPSGFSIRFLRWSQRPGDEELHDRFILTELGGVRYTVGLDYGPSSTHTGIVILSKESYEKQVRDYLSDSPAFNLTDELTITGP